MSLNTTLSTGNIFPIFTDAFISFFLVCHVWCYIAYPGRLKCVYRFQQQGRQVKRGIGKADSTKCLKDTLSWTLELSNDIEITIGLRHFFPQHVLVNKIICICTRRPIGTIYSYIQLYVPWIKISGVTVGSKTGPARTAQQLLFSYNMDRWHVESNVLITSAIQSFSLNCSMPVLPLSLILLIKFK